MNSSLHRIGCHEFGGRTIYQSVKRTHAGAFRELRSDRKPAITLFRTIDFFEFSFQICKIAWNEHLAKNIKEQKNGFIATLAVTRTSLLVADPQFSGDKCNHSEGRSHLNHYFQPLKFFSTSQTIAQTTRLHPKRNFLLWTLPWRRKTCSLISPISLLNIGYLEHLFMLVL